MIPIHPVTISRHLLSLNGESVLLHEFVGGTTASGPFTMAVDLSMSSALASWIEGPLSGTSTKKSGVIVAVTPDNKAVSYHFFRNAAIETITCPALDTSSTSVGSLRITCRPEDSSSAPGDNALQTIAFSQKTWLCSNFRTRIGALPCGTVSRIDAFTIRQRASTANIRLIFAVGDSKPWKDWYADFVVRGNNGPEQRLEGTIEFLNINLSAVLAAVGLSQVGIVSLTELSSPDRDSEAFDKVLVELSVGALKIQIAARG